MISCDNNKKLLFNCNQIMYKNILSFLSKAKNILVLGKGKLQQNIKCIENKYDICVGVKQSIAILKKKDILVMNDFEGLFGLENCISEIKFILCPAKVHLAHEPINNKLLYTYLHKHNFKGEIVLYEIYTNCDQNPSLEYVNLVSSGDVIFHFINKCSNAHKKCIDVYGIYTCLEDNNKIKNIIVNAKISQKYIKLFLSYLKRVYTNKKKINMKCLYLCDDDNISTEITIKHRMLERQNMLKIQYPKLRIIFIH